MSLAAGTRLGPYEVLGLIGVGGMGEVYKARDTRLDRTVAIKVLPPELASDPERRTRFEREARTISGLNHQHICTLHDVGDRDGVPFLVMEHLEGQTLAERLKKGPLPLDQVLDLGGQIADALSTAHRHGIVHRDLKPANVMMTKAGAKLLDFGLAKLKGHGERAALVVEASTGTEAEFLTGCGTILGTLPYMAPEQLEGKPADARTDLWALGTMLYEMVTGKRAFEGTSSVSLIGQIMNAEPPPLASRKPLTPPGLDRLVRRALSKSPDDRWESAHDVADELRWIGETVRASATGSTVRSSLVRMVGLAIVFPVVFAIGSAVWWVRARPVEPQVVTRADITLPADVEPYRGTAQSAGWSPDGNIIVFIGVRDGVRRLYVRQRDRDEVTPLQSTANSVSYSCFFSPDGRSVGYISSDGVLRRVTLADGLVATVTDDVATTAGGTWAADGRITFVHGGTLWQVDARGGQRQQLTRLDAKRGELVHQWPNAIRGGQVILFASAAKGGPATERVEALSINTLERRVLIDSGTFPMYASSGHLLFFRGGSLLAAPFDVDRLNVTGAPARVLENVEVDSTGAPLAGVSGAGSLAYVARATNVSRLVWVSREGVERPVTDASRRYLLPRLSPDGRRIIVGEGGTLWMQDTARAALSRVSSDESTGNSWPVWTPDGKRVVFRSVSGMRWVDVDSGGPSHPITGTSVADRPSSVSADGSTLAFLRASPETSSDLYVLSLVGEPNPRPLLATPAYEGGPQFSPDGRWVVYVSNESGEMEVYIRPLGGPERKWQVSTKGGTQPRWSRNGREIVYRNSTRMMAVSVSTSPGLKLSEPQVLFEGRYAFGPAATTPNYDVTPDGQQFVMVKDEPGSNTLKVVFNWFEELKAKVPVAR